MRAPSPKESYETLGFAVHRNVIPGAMIDRLLERYRSEIVRSRTKFFRQNTNAYEPNRLTSHGYVEQSFLDIHDYRRHPHFSRAAIELFTSAEVREALTATTGYAKFNLMQTMLFDANTETVAHQDWWYLDSVPNGHLTGAWFALEDIDEAAGRFYVMSGSHLVDLHSDTPDLPHKDWLARCAEHAAAHPDDIVAPPLRKGDVLLWNSRTIHGSLPTRDPKYSRKSLTAHYLPTEYQFGNLFTVKPWVEYKTHNGMNFYRNQPDYSLVASLKSGVKTSVYSNPAVLRNLRKVQNLVSRLR